MELVESVIWVAMGFAPAFAVLMVGSKTSLKKSELILSKKEKQSSYKTFDGMGSIISGAGGAGSRS